MFDFNYIFVGKEVLFGGYKRIDPARVWSQRAYWLWLNQKWGMRDFWVGVCDFLTSDWRMENTFYPHSQGQPVFHLIWVPLHGNTRLLLHSFFFSFFGGTQGENRETQPATIF